jgi:hypothetical protein
MEEETKSRLKSKAVEAGKAGLSTLGSILEKRKKERQASVDFAGKLVKETSGMVGRSELGRVEMGLPPDLDEQGIPMKSAMGLFSDTYKPSLEGSDVSALSNAMGKEVEGSVPKDYSSRDAQYLQERKRRVVLGSIGRRNPELYPKPGGGGSEDTTSSLLGQLNRQKPMRGSKYESQ